MKLQLISIYTILLLSLIGCGGGSSTNEESNSPVADSNSNNIDSSSTDDGIRLIKRSTYKTAEKKILLYTSELKYDKNLRLVSQYVNNLTTQTKINFEFKYKDNLMIEVIVKPDENASLIDGAIRGSIKHNYDNKGKLIEILNYNSKDKLLSKHFGLDWDNDDKVTKWKDIVYDNDANISQTSTHVVSYDNKNVIRERINSFFSNGTLFSTAIFDYEYDNKKVPEDHLTTCRLLFTVGGCSSNNIVKMTYVYESTSTIVSDYTYDFVYKENGLPLNRTTTAEVSTESPGSGHLTSIIEDSAKQYEEYEYNKD